MSWWNREEAPRVGAQHVRGREGGSGIREVSRAWLLETCGLRGWSMTEVGRWVGVGKVEQCAFLSKRDGKPREQGGSVVQLKLKKITTIAMVRTDCDLHGAGVGWGGGQDGQETRVQETSDGTQTLGKKRSEFEQILKVACRRTIRPELVAVPLKLSQHCSLAIL